MSYREIWNTGWTIRAATPDDGLGALVGRDTISATSGSAGRGRSQGANARTQGEMGAEHRVCFGTSGDFFWGAYSISLGKLKSRNKDYRKRRLKDLVVTRLRCSPRSSLAYYLFLESFSNYHTPSGKLLDAPGELCDARKEGHSAPGTPQG